MGGANDKSLQRNLIPTGMSREANATDNSAAYHTIERITILLSTLGDQPHGDLIATSDDIAFFEHEFNVRLPEEYKQFLTHFGWIAYGGEFIGLASAYTELSALQKKHPEFPINIVPIHQDVHGDYYCLVCSGTYNGQIILWQPGIPANEAFPNVPAGKQDDYWTRASDFWAWLGSQLEREAALQMVLKWLGGGGGSTKSAMMHAEDASQQAPEDRSKSPQIL